MQARAVYRCLWPFFLLAGISCVLVLFYVGAEDQIYFWDFGGYFHRTTDLSDTIRSGSIPISNVVWSIRNEDYNLLPILPLIPANLLFGNSREVYVCAVLVLYWIPVCLLAASTANYALNGSLRAPHKLPIWYLLAALFYWPFLAPVLRGFPDIVGLIPFGLACLLIANRSIWSKRLILRGLVLGALIWSTFALRRWYAYSCVALLLVAGLIALVGVFRSQNRPEAFRDALLEYGACGVVVILLLSMQWPFVSRVLGASYADAYADYQQPFPEHLVRVFNQLGPILTLGIVTGLVRAVLERNSVILIYGAVALVSFSLFSLTQAPGVQHVLPWAFLLFPAFAAGLTWPLKADFLGMQRWTGIGVMAVSMIVVFWPAAANTLSFASILTPAKKYPPLEIYNVDNYRQLAADLHGLMGPQDRATVYSWTAPSVMLEAIEPALRNKLIHPAMLDRRDGFRVSALESEFVVVMHAVKSKTEADVLIPSQATIIPSRLIREGQGLGSAFRLVWGPYELGGCPFTNVQMRCAEDAPLPQAYIYERIRPITQSERQDLRDRFLSVYPEWQDRADGYGPP